MKDSVEVWRWRRQNNNLGGKALRTFTESSRRVEVPERCWSWSAGKRFGQRKAWIVEPSSVAPVGSCTQNHIVVCTYRGKRPVGQTFESHRPAGTLIGIPKSIWCVLDLDWDRKLLLPLLRIQKHRVGGRSSCARLRCNDRSADFTARVLTTRRTSLGWLWRELSTRVRAARLALCHAVWLRVIILKWNVL